MLLATVRKDPLQNMAKRGDQPAESTAGQNQQELAAGESSDSGDRDSLFITQKEIPAPRRSARRKHLGKRSGLTSSRCLEETEVESSSSLFQEESRTPQKTARKKITLPVYTFSFLADNKSDGFLPSRKNRTLNTFSVAGFFKCLSEFDTAKTSSPTVDADEEDISPLSEEEEEQSHTEGFRVVDKTCFVTALKATSCRPWCSQRKQQERMNAGRAGEETLRENGLRTQENIAAEASTSTNVPLPERRRSSDNAAHSSKVLSENEREEPTPNTALTTNRWLTPGTKEASRDNNSNASVCEPPDGGGGGEVCSLTQREETVDTHPTLLHTSPLHGSNNDSMCMDTRVKKRKKKKKKAKIHASMEGQREEEPEDVCLLESVTLEVEAQAPQSTDETESSQLSLHDDQTGRQEERTSRKDRKRRKRKSKTADTLWEDHLESDVMLTDSMISLEGGGKKEKIKDDDDDDVRQSEQYCRNDAEGMKVKRKKHKDKKTSTADEWEKPVKSEGEESVKSSEKSLTLETGVELSYPKSIREATGALGDRMPNTKGLAEEQKEKKHEVRTDVSEDGVKQSDFSVAVQKKENQRSSSSLCADAGGKDVQTARKRISVPAEHVDTQSAETTENSEQPDRRVKKKKRKRKRDYQEDADSGVERKKDRGRNGNGPGTDTERMEHAAVLTPLTKKKSKEDSCCMSGDVSTHVGTCERFSQTPGKLALKEESVKTEASASADPLQEELLTTSKHSEFRKKKKERAAAPLAAEMSFSTSEISSPDCVVSKKHRKLKRKLYHPAEDLLE